MTKTWKSFWHEYRNHTPETEADLFMQVGRTVDGQPISAAEFQRSVQHVVEKLDVQPQDIVFEFCCGNGLLSFELGRTVRQVIGIDFADHLIDAARRLRKRENVTYHVGDALQPIESFTGRQRPTKYLISHALAYFDPAGLSTILQHTLAVSPRGSFVFLATGIPDSGRMWNFYDTPERRARRLHAENAGDVLNDGMGRWWSTAEIVDVARRHGLTAEVAPEPPGLTNYRSDALIR
jgi:SAM-dependent methyltransferase